MDSSKLRVGIIGTGGRGVDCFGKLLRRRGDVELVAFCDPNPARMRKAAAELEISPSYHSSVEAMVAGGGLDAVVITSPDFCHEANAVAALKGGLNALIDKPLATTVKGCRAIIAAAAKSGKSAIMGFNLRHVETLKKLKSLVGSGELGKVFLIENREFYDGGKTYMSRWNRKYECSGGLWIHKGSHDFDIFNWLLGFPKPYKVSASAAVNVLKPEGLPFAADPGVPAGPTCDLCAYKGKCPDAYLLGADAKWGAEAEACDGYRKNLCMYLSDKDTHDNGIAMVEYEGGVRASHLECFVTSISDRLYTVVGDKGMAEVSLERRTIMLRPRWSQETILHQLPEAVGGHGGADPSLVASFIDLCKGVSGQAAATLEQGLLSTAIGQAAELSVRGNRTIFMDELLG